ncbi:MAG: Cytochrome c oxidase subunit 6 [Icmadophila ericetorum]|nr:Cytochrome c oxidase subunit 6 [Icmadophila ericetorum]
MSTIYFARLASRTPSSHILLRSTRGTAVQRLPAIIGARELRGKQISCSGTKSFGTTSSLKADKDGQEAADHHEESFEEFTARYEKEFDSVQDVFELQRNLNNAFAYDLVPSTSVITAALRAARRVNDFPTAVRIFEGIKAKVENKSQYDEYLSELKPLREELGVNLKEDLYPDPSRSQKFGSESA